MAAKSGIAYSFFPCGLLRISFLSPASRYLPHRTEQGKRGCEARSARRRPRHGLGARVRSGQAVPGETPEQQQQQPRAPAARGSSRRRSGPGEGRERARSGPGAGRERAEPGAPRRFQTGPGSASGGAGERDCAGTARGLRGDSLADSGWRGQLFARAVAVLAAVLAAVPVVSQRLSQRCPSGWRREGAKALRTGSRVSCHRRLEMRRPRGDLTSERLRGG